MLIYRFRYIILILVTIVLGIGSRRFPETLPEFVTLHFGDALWAAMVYFGFRFLLPQKSLLFSGILAFLFSVFIELSQLYHADWINGIRSTTLGALILGSGFLWIDLLRYFAGVSLALLVDYILNNLLKRKSSSP